MRLIQAALLLLLSILSPHLYAACSAYGINGQASINEIYKLTTGTGQPSFIEIKLVDQTILDAVYNDWTVQICSSWDCDTYSVSTFENYYPWLFLQSPSLDDSDIVFKKGGFDISLRDGSGDIIDYLSVNGVAVQNLNSCNLNDLAISDHYLSKIPGGTKIIERVGPDGGGDWDLVTSNAVDETPGADNESSQVEPPHGFSCSAADSFTQIVTDDFSTDASTWSAVNFNRNINNWAGQAIYTNASENQDVVYSITGGSLQVNGTLSAANDNEYGMVEHNFANSFTTTDPNQYSIYTEVSTHYGDFGNNDFGIVFAFEDDENYYLARWTKYGADLSGDTTYPGTYRRLELIKVVNGVATVLDRLNRNESIIETYAAHDNTIANSTDGNVSMKVVVTDQGTGVCVGNYNGSGMILQLYSDESPLLNSAGLYSYDNDVGLTFDNVEIRCDNCPSTVTSVVLYEFEDADTDFSDGVEDSNGLLDGINLGGASTDDGKYCRAFESLPNSSSATSNAFETGVTLTSGYTKGSVSFWFNSATNWNTGSERTLWDASNFLSAVWETYNTNFVLKIDSSGRLLFSVEEANIFGFFGDESYVTTEGAVTRTADTWYYITTTWDYTNGEFQIFVDGALVASQSVGSALDFPNGLEKIIIGDNASGNVGTGILPSANSANGKFDNVKIYNKVITTTEIIADMDGVDCVDPDPTFVIEHDGNGITCMPEPVTIMACLDASCTTTDTNVNTTIDLLINGGASQTVNIVNGVASLNFNYTDTVNNAILSSSADYVCRNTSVINSLGQTDVDCGVNFSDTGFVFNTINNQVAGVDFNQSVTIQAVQADENGACSALFNNTTSIGFALQYQTPITTTLNDYTIGGTAINKVVGQPVADDYVEIDVPFNASGVGTLPTNIYYDAGQVSLHAYKVIAATPELSAVTLTGNSNDFWVQPHRFEISSPISGFVGASTTHAAGVDFSYEIKAVNLQGATTTNYRQGNIRASVVRQTPTSVNATDGIFTFSNSLGTQQVNSAIFIDRGYDFGTNGEVSISTGEYDEVGSVSFDIQDNNYGGIGLVVNAAAVELGRFIPDYFEQTVAKHGGVTGSCGNWVYTGELDGSGSGTINYSTEPQLSIVAKNDHGFITRNYRSFDDTGENFVKLTELGVTIAAPTQDIDQIGALGTPMLLSANISHDANALEEVDNIASPSPQPIGGELTYTFNIADNFVYTRDVNAVFTPFTAEFDIAITSIIDSDHVQATTLENVEIRNDVQVRFGRMVLDNSYGPETSALPQPLSTEYLTDLASMTFTLNTDDNCTVVSNAASNWTITDGDTSNGLTASDISLQGSGGLIASGTFDEVTLQNDSAERGSVNVEYIAPAWLLFDWDNDGLHDNNPTAVATFGRYRGNDRIIYWKEVNN